MIYLSRMSLLVGLMTGLLAGCATPSSTVTPTVAPTATMAPTVTAGPTLQPGDSSRKLTVKGLERSYLLHIPSGLDSLRPVPVVFAFHEFDSSGITLRSLTGFNEIADKEGFLVIYPEGSGLFGASTWNNGGGCCGYAAINNVDEAAFVRQILSDVVTIVSIDTKRIYATGFSHGASLPYRLACEMSDTFAAIAPVSGVLLYSPCKPKEPVSAIHVHGLNDNHMPYHGDGHHNSPPVESVIKLWAQLDGCTNTPEIEKLQNNTITHTAYDSCKAGTAVELYTFESGTSSWPQKSVWPTSQIIWDFFAAHPKP